MQRGASFLSERVGAWHATAVCICGSPFTGNVSQNSVVSAKMCHVVGVNSQAHELWQEVAPMGATA
jgi:hypothetical protein